ncbi:MAG: polymerase [Proteobacteria bacterium]|nr:polymerase [Pseudomonadota bacterium]
MIAISFILLCVLIVIALYFFTVKMEGKVVNAMVPYIIISMPTLYIFECFYIYLTGGTEYTVEYMFFYACYIIYIFSFMAGYLLTQNNNISEEKFRQKHRYGMASLFFTILAFVFYLPVLIEFKEYLLQPRRIYELTRTGYGIYFYPSLMFSLIASICAFFIYKRHKFFAFLTLSSNILLILLHGNKGPIFSIFIAFIIYLSYIENRKIKLMFLFKSVAVISLIVTVFFAYTYAGGNPLENMAYYSDYTRNAVLIAHSDFDFMYGQLMLESEIYSRIPRALWHSKPDDFGALYLAKVFFPDAFYRNQGAPAFGYGEYFADFGYLTPLWLLISGVFKGILAKYFSNKTQQTKSAHYFILFLFCIGVSVIPVSMGWLFPEHVVIAVMVFMVSTMKISKHVDFVLIRKRS